MTNRPAHIEFKTKILAGGVLAVISLVGLMRMPPFTNFLGGQTSTLSVHLLMELFAITIATLVVNVSWHTFDAREARSANILICGFLIIAICDLVHALTYKGMPALLAESSTPRAIFFWLMGRTVEVVTMLLVALAWAPPLSRGFWLCMGFIVSGLLIWFGSYDIDAFPLTFVAGKGVTPFKAIYEYVLCITNLLVAIIFWHQARRTGENRPYLLSLSSFVMGIGELAFTSYVTPSDFQTIFGHSYKLMAYALIYRATFVSSIRAPFDELHRSEERLSESRARYHSALSSLSEGVLIQQGDGTILEANGAAETILGLSVEQLIGHNSSEVVLHPIHEDETPWPASEHPAVMTLKTGKTIPEAIMGFHKPDGSLAWISINSRPIVTPGEQAPLTVVTSFADITARKQEEARFHYAVEAAPNAMIMVDAQHIIVLANTRTSDMFGYPQDELIGQHINLLIPQKTHASHAAHLKTFSTERKGRQMGTGRDLFGQHKDGSLIPVEVGLNPLQTNEGRFVIASVVNITERKLAMEKLQEKNIELERYTHMVSHDLKSPLVTIKTFLGYLKQDMLKNDSARIEKDMEFMSKAADKMGQLLDELQEMSRIGRIVSMPVHVAWRDVVEEALTINAGAIAQRGVLVAVEEADIVLFGERARLVQVWQNLIDNAVKFMGDQPEPRIRIGVKKDESATNFFVCDNGIGVDTRYHDKIFGMFEKLNSHAPGSGLGLALVQRIVQLYRGEISIESEGAGHGACFRFTLPEALKKGKSGEPK